MMYHVVFRADSSYKIGIGHIMRCITLAQAIKKQLNARIYFFTRKNPGNINAQITEHGFELIEMEPAHGNTVGTLKHSNWLGKTQKDDAAEVLSLLIQLKIPSIDCLIIDHYGIDFQWQKYLKNIIKKTLVIDDLGDRKQCCDFLLDQTYNCTENKYKNLVSDNCKLLLGTQYALVRDEFQLQESKVNAPPSRPNNKKILIMFGGSDPSNLTLQALNIVVTRKDLTCIKIILSKSAQHLKIIKGFCNNRDNLELHISPENIATLMQESTLAIGAAGTTSWERCASGLPAIVIIQADNQKQIAKELEATGVISCLEENEIQASLNHHLDKWLAPNVIDDKIVNSCLKICDAKGCDRVINEVFSDIL